MMQSTKYKIKLNYITQIFIITYNPIIVVKN